MNNAIKEFCAVSECPGAPGPAGLCEAHAGSRVCGGHVLAPRRRRPADEFSHTDEDGDSLKLFVNDEGGALAKVVLDGGEFFVASLTPGAVERLHAFLEPPRVEGGGAPHPRPVLRRGDRVVASRDLEACGASAGTFGVVFEESDAYGDGGGPMVAFANGGCCNVYAGDVAPFPSERKPGDDPVFPLQGVRLLRAAINKYNPCTDCGEEPCLTMLKAMKDTEHLA